MLIFDFLKKLLGWADDAPRKRRAVSFSCEKEFVTPKKHRCDHTPDDVVDTFIEINEDSDSDCVEIPAKHKYSCIESCNRLNGTHRGGDKSFPLCTSSFSPPSKPRTCRSKLNMGYFSSKNEVQNIGTNHRCPTLAKTHRLKEKNQYEELLQNFLPQKMHVISSKREKERPEQEVVEIVDLDKSSLNISPKANSTFKRHDIPTHSRWSTQSKEEKSKEIPIIIDVKKKNELAHSSHNKSQINRSSADLEKSTESKRIEHVKTNSLRDQLAAKAVIRGDFIPQVAKRYNERIEQRYKEAEELKKMTCVLSKHNRLAREAALEEHLARSMRLCEVVLDEREDSEEVLLPRLTDQMLQEVKNALIPRPPDEVLIEGFGLRITRKDIHTLADLNWLNDEVINFYMNLLISRSTNDKYPKVHAMNTFFYPKLLSGGHSSLKRWTRKIDIFAQDLVVVPVHLGIHWCMSIIDFRDKSIRYYDSMGSSNPKCLSALRQYLEDESLDKKKQAYNTSNWTLESAKNIPQQMNGSDCGVFSCMFAEYVCANKKITFTQQDMPYFRNKMVYEILKSKLL